MTQEEKQILIKYLCAILPYSVWGLHRGEDLPLYVMDNSGAYMVLGYNAWFDLDTVPFKPYLRPMSSMTEEEEDDLRVLKNCLVECNEDDDEKFYGIIGDIHNFYYSRHIDCNSLIDRGLALEAPEGMYKTE